MGFSGLDGRSCHDDGAMFESNPTTFVRHANRNHPPRRPCARSRVVDRENRRVKIFRTPARRRSDRPRVARRTVRRDAIAPAAPLLHASRSPDQRPIRPLRDSRDIWPTTSFLVREENVRRGERLEGSARASRGRNSRRRALRSNLDPRRVSRRGAWVRVRRETVGRGSLRLMRARRSRGSASVRALGRGVGVARRDRAVGAKADAPRAMAARARERLAPGEGQVGLVCAREHVRAGD